MANLLTAQLAILDRVDPERAQRLRWPVSDAEHAVADGQPARKVNLVWRPATATDGEIASRLDAAPPTSEEPLLILGAGAGALVAAALERWPGREIVLYEPHPMQLRVALSRADLTQALSSRRLRLRMAADLPLLTGSSGWPGPVVQHPLADLVSRWEARLLKRGGDGPWALIRPGMLFTDDVADSLRRRGHRVAPLPLGRWSERELRLLIDRTRPRLLASINHPAGLSEFAETVGVPLLSWEIDPTVERPTRPRVPPRRTLLFTWRRANVKAWAEQGYPQVAWLPLAANPRRRRPIPPDEIPDEDCATVAFVGASMADSALRSRAAALQSMQTLAGLSADDAHAVLQQILQLQRQHPERYLVPGLVEQALPALAVAQGPVDPIVQLGEVVSAERRLNLVARLGGLGAAVWGDHGWQLVEKAGVDYRGFAAHGDQLSRIYSAATVNVDIGRLYQLDIVTMRVFDVLACGGFLLAERSAELSELFVEGQHLAAWTTPRELVDSVQLWRSQPQAARRIAEAGRRHVLARHTVDHRVDTMLAAAEQVGLLRPSDATPTPGAPALRG